MTINMQAKPAIHILMAIAVVSLSLFISLANADSDVDKPQHFDSDRLMAILAENGIVAQWDSELIIPREGAERERNPFVNVMVLRVKKPLTETEWDTASNVVGNFLASQVEHMFVFYELLGIRAESENGKVEIRAIVYPSNHP